MGLVIKNNLMADRGARLLNATYGKMAGSVEKLASGLRINRASDDPAGMAVRELMRSDITVLSQGVRNAQDGISLLQTAEGALSVVDEKLVRMKELAEQAATGTYNSSQRSMMNSEFQALADEIERIGKATEFNGIKVLDSASGTVKIHFGTGNAAAEDYVNINLTDCTKSGLGVSSLVLTSAASAAAALSTMDSAIATKDAARAAFGYAQNRLEGTIANLQIQAENIQDAESRISDVDVAIEMSAFTRTQVLAQAGVSMLAQANSVPQLALSLLR